MDGIDGCTQVDRLQASSSVGGARGRSQVPMVTADRAHQPDRDIPPTTTTRRDVYPWGKDLVPCPPPRPASVEVNGRELRRKGRRRPADPGRRHRHARWSPTSCTNVSSATRGGLEIVDRDDVHPATRLPLPALRWLREQQVVSPRHAFIADGVDLVLGDVDRVRPEANTVTLTDGRALPYDYLVIASGTCPAPTRPRACSAPSGDAASSSFYPRRGQGARGGPEALRPRSAGRARDRDADQVPGRAAGVRVPRRGVAAPEGVRDRVELTYVTPLPGAFTQPVASAHLGSMLDERKIAVEPDFQRGSSGSTRSRRWCRTTSASPFDLLVTVPLNMGADFVARSGLGDEAQLRPGGQAHDARASTTTSSRSATPATSRRRRPARWRTSRSRSSSRTSSSASRACR